LNVVCLFYREDFANTTLVLCGMQIDVWNAALFTLAAIMLLGSPGPAIAALIAIGKDRGFAGSLRYFWGLQIGLGLGAAVSAAGLASVLLAVPFAVTAMTVVATIYLVWLAYTIAAAPLTGGPDQRKSVASSSARAGFLLGATNPKAYLAFVSLMASYAIAPKHPPVDAGIKWLLCAIVMIVVDLIWLWLGAVLGMARLGPTAERTMNVTMGATILLTAGLAFL
jgi:threonine/homoserine/homoserine lactone efflux protein